MEFGNMNHSILEQEKGKKQMDLLGFLELGLVILAFFVLPWLTAKLTMMLDFLMAWKNYLWWVRYRLAFRAIRQYDKKHGSTLTGYFKKLWRQATEKYKIETPPSEVDKIETSAQDIDDIYTIVADRVFWFKMWMCPYCFGMRIALIASTAFWTVYSLNSSLAIGWLVGLSIPFILFTTALNHYYISRSY